MPIKSCRGEKNRENLVRDFEIKPLRHSVLFNGQTQQSCAGPILDREYYVFSYKNRKNPEDSGTFICGISAANHFIELIKQVDPTVDRLHIFNPFYDFQEKQVTGKNSHSDLHQQNNSHRNMIAKELYEAINMICMMWNIAELKDPLKSILTRINKLDSPPSDADIRTVNTIIRNKFINDEIASLNNAFRQFSEKNKIDNIKTNNFVHLTKYFNNNLINEKHQKAYFL